LIGRLPEMPVPLFEADSFVAGLEEAGSFVAGLREWGTFVAGQEGEGRQTSWKPATSRGDRELGAIAQYELRFDFPLEAYAPLDEEQVSRMTDVTQVVVFLSDADAAARWLMTQTRRLEDFEGREVGGYLYRKVYVDITLAGLGEEAAVVVTHREGKEAGTLSRVVDTSINFRTGRLFGSVGASTREELEVLPPLREMAEAFLSRMESVLAGRPVSLRPVAPFSWRDQIIGGVAGLAIFVGWPSAVVLFFAHRWGSLFTSDVASYIGRAFVLVVGCFTAFAAAAIGFGPWMEEEHISAGSLLALLAVAFGPTIVLALLFYGHV
jgi:hypothetical protein